MLTTQPSSVAAAAVAIGVNVARVAHGGEDCGVGGPEAFADLIGGRVDMTFENILTAGRVAQDGKLTELAVTSLERSPLLPDVPTLHESGLNGFEVTAWVGLVAPPGTPLVIVERPNAAAVAALREPAVVERLRGLGFTPAGGTAAEFASHIAKESAKWGQVTKSAGIRAEIVIAAA